MEVKTKKGLMVMGPHTGGSVKIPTIKVYKGAKDVTINKEDLKEWQERGWKTSSERQKGSKKEAKDEAE